MKMYRLSDGVYVRTRADLPPRLAALVDPRDEPEMQKACEYFRKCKLAEDPDGYQS